MIDLHWIYTHPYKRVLSICPVSLYGHILASILTREFLPKSRHIRMAIPRLPASWALMYKLKVQYFKPGSLQQTATYALRSLCNEQRR